VVRKGYDAPTTSACIARLEVERPRRRRESDCIVEGFAGIGSAEAGASEQQRQLSVVQPARTALGPGELPHRTKVRGHASRTRGHEIHEDRQPCR